MYLRTISCKIGNNLLFYLNIVNVNDVLPRNIISIPNSSQYILRRRLPSIKTGESFLNYSSWFLHLQSFRANTHTK